MEMTMTIQTETNSAVQGLSRWQKFQTWLTIVTKAIDYDPQAHTAATIKILRNDVERLGARVVDLEKNGAG